MIFLLAYWRVGLVAAALLFGWWYIEHEKTKAFERGKGEGQLELLESQKQQLEIATAEARATIEQERMALEAQQQTVADERAALSDQRRQMNAELNRGVVALTRRETEIRNANLTVADSALVPEIRNRLVGIRAAESTRTAR